MLTAQLDADLKAALIARDELKLTTLRSLKSAITYAKVDDRARGGDGELSDESILAIFAKESKKRQESADAFTGGGNYERANKELAEKVIIDGYLPAQLSDEDINNIIDKAISEIGSSDAKVMGQVISKVKTLAGSRAEGARVAQLVKEKLN